MPEISNKPEMSKTIKKKKKQDIEKRETIA